MNCETIHRLAMLVDSPIEIIPLALDLGVLAMTSRKISVIGA
jgi:hypothetical protein